MRLVRMVGIVGLLGAGMACGGGDKKVEAPAVVSDDDGTASDDDGAGDDLMPQEKLDDLKAFFDRKRRHIARCWVEALDAGEVPKNDHGAVTVDLTITSSGAPTKVRISKSSHSSDVLKECVIGRVKKWKLPTLPESIDYSYTFGFERL